PASTITGSRPTWRRAWAAASPDWPPPMTSTSIVSTPSFLPGWLACADGGAADGARQPLHGLLVGHLDLGLLEAGLHQVLAIRIDGDRPGDAAGPGIESPLYLGGELPELDHVGDREPAAWLEHPERLADHGALVLREIDDTVGDDHVDRGIGQRHLLDGALEEDGVL